MSFVGLKWRVFSYWTIAEYIRAQANSDEIADKFLDEIVRLAEKLSFIADAYADGRFHVFPLKNGHSVKFLVVGSYIMIAAFLPRGIDH